MSNGTPHYKWPFSIAMLNYQRVNPIKMIQKKRLQKGGSFSQEELWLSHIQMVGSEMVEPGQRKGLSLEIGKWWKMLEPDP